MEKAIPDGTRREGLASDMAEGLRAALVNMFMDEHIHISHGKIRLRKRLAILYPLFVDFYELDRISVHSPYISLTQW